VKQETTTHNRSIVFAGLSNPLAQFGSTADWFATAENLLSHEEPIFIAEKFTDCGKWMDGWETRRKRIAGALFGGVALLACRLRAS